MKKGIFKKSSQAFIMTYLIKAVENSVDIDRVVFRQARCMQTDTYLVKNSFLNSGVDDIFPLQSHNQHFHDPYTLSKL